MTEERERGRGRSLVSGIIDKARSMSRGGTPSKDRSPSTARESSRGRRPRAESDQEAKDEARSRSRSRSRARAQVIGRGGAGNHVPVGTDLQDAEGLGESEAALRDARARAPHKSEISGRGGRGNVAPHRAPDTLEAAEEDDVKEALHRSQEPRPYTTGVGGFGNVVK